ncbi:MAG: histidine phosphatase family protein [Clostridiales bacterium]|nr:histidine phosphatase family protein [Clostridiales bacterium]
MRLIIVRHGDPDYENDCLTELGHRQAEIAAQRLLQEQISEIYSSSCGRAIETAEAFSKASGIQKIDILDFMKEIRFGREEHLYTELNPWYGVDDMIQEGWDLRDPDWREHPIYKENTATVDVDQIAKATDTWLQTLGYEREGLYYRNTNAVTEEKTIALFCHGGSETAMLSHIYNLPFPFLCGTIHMPHTAISILRFDKRPGSLNQPILELLSDATHLRQMKEGIRVSEYSKNPNIT